MSYFKHSLYFVIVLSILVGLLSLPGLSASRESGAQAPATDGSVRPHYRVDPFWPKTLPDKWILGQVGGLAVDGQDDVWILQRPRSLEALEAAAAQKPPAADCCRPAPAVIEFSPEGKVKQAWGGPRWKGAGTEYEWPEGEHGLYVDHLDNVWIAGNGGDDHQVLKFTSDGTFLMQIGRAGKTAGSNSRRFLGQPADITVDPARNEVYVADGYRNHRVIVFDADTGRYKRHWGAYGKRPTDEEITPISGGGKGTPSQFANPVHCVVIASDGLVYVCDRANNRMQVFRKNGDFVREFFIERDTLGNGSTWDVDFSPDARDSFLFNADGTNQYIWTLLRRDARVLGHFGRHGRYAGQFHWVHSMGVDSSGNLYTGEVDTGKRVQKFELRGYVSTAAR